ncbi:hypothetical protein CEXT_541341 [Caerostris extrusa]|uniref:Uncharacterized protein n=1 Tax=Caerostris extrusa TaxID=172846 RepID=A0AAV4XC50_CAEEX|nr:hypothetical protein CEXT_541341 [Caerostris extrusa]
MFLSVLGGRIERFAGHVGPSGHVLGTSLLDIQLPSPFCHPFCRRSITQLLIFFPLISLLENLVIDSRRNPFLDILLRSTFRLCLGRNIIVTYSMLSESPINSFNERSLAFLNSSKINDDIKFQLKL